GCPAHGLRGLRLRRPAGLPRRPRPPRRGARRPRPPRPRQRRRRPARHAAGAAVSARLRWRPAVGPGLLLVAVEAAARVGGGEGFGTGRGGGGGGGGGYGGGAAVDGDLVYLLIHLLVRYPQVGVPVLVIVVVLWTLSQRSGGGTWVVEGHAPDHRPVRR